MIDELIFRIRSVYDPTGEKQLVKGMKKIQEEERKIQEAAKGAVITMNKGLTETTQLAKKASNDLKKFRFEWLGVMFAGMAMQRAFSGLLKASFQTWSAVTEGTQMAGGAMIQLQGAWEYFKYSLFEALLSSSLFQTFVGFVITLVEWWSNLSDTTKSVWATLVIVGLAFGSILFIVGQLALALNSISALIYGQNFAIGLLSKSFVGLGNTIAKVYALSAPVLLIAGILLAIGYIVWMKKELGGTWEFFKAFARGVIMASAVMGAGFIRLVGGAIDFVMGQIENFLIVIRAVASVVDRLTGTNFASQINNAVATISQLRGGLSGLFDAAANNITAQAAEFVLEKIPLKSEGTDVSFSAYLSEMSQAVVEGIKGAAPEIGDAMGKSSAKYSSGNKATTMIQMHQDNFQRAGLDIYNS